MTKISAAEKRKQHDIAAFNASTMNEICSEVNGKKEDGGLKGDIHMNFKGIPNFNYRMLLSHVEGPVNLDVRQAFLDEIAKANSGLIDVMEDGDDQSVVGSYSKFQLACDKVKIAIFNIVPNLESAYDTMVVDMYAGKNLDKITSKKYFWEIFGEIAERNLTYNLQHCHQCEKCGQLVPDWDYDHQHQGEDEMHYQCPDCGMIFEFNLAKDNNKTKDKVKRCPDCYSIYAAQKKKSDQKAYAEKQKKQREEERRRKEEIERIEREAKALARLEAEKRAILAQYGIEKC